MTAVLQRRVGVAVLLVYGLRVPVPRDGQPGFRLTVQIDGAVHVEPVGFDLRHRAHLAALNLMRQCQELDLVVSALPGKTPGFVVRRRPARP